MFLYEYGDSIDNKRYFYEVYLEEGENGEFEGIRVDLTLRAIKPWSRLTFYLGKEGTIDYLDKKISKIVEKHYKAHIDYKGEADPELLKEK